MHVANIGPDLFCPDPGRKNPLKRVCLQHWLLERRDPKFVSNFLVVLIRKVVLVGHVLAAEKFLKQLLQDVTAVTGMLRV